MVEFNEMPYLARGVTILTPDDLLAAWEPS
jgi:hypothetical protein